MEEPIARVQLTSGETARQIEIGEQNRAQFSPEQLQPYDGQWVAFSADESRIVAAAADLITLNRLVGEAGEDPEEVGLERIILEDDWLGSADLD
ncbi:MAG TPA: hypothetical protein VML55_23435 [Planctomycetaceae bacterium]|nr:hypothetical protein [Planctomycetaceae bacterium]